MRHFRHCIKSPPLAKAAKGRAHESRLRADKLPDGCHFPDRRASVLGTWLVGGGLLSFQNLLDDFGFMLATILPPGHLGDGYLIWTSLRLLRIYRVPVSRMGHQAHRLRPLLQGFSPQPSLRAANFPCHSSALRRPGTQSCGRCALPGRRALREQCPYRAPAPLPAAGRFRLCTRSSGNACASS